MKDVKIYKNKNFIMKSFQVILFILKNFNNYKRIFNPDFILYLNQNYFSKKKKLKISKKSLKFFALKLKT